MQRYNLTNIVSDDKNINLSLTNDFELDTSYLVDDFAQTELDNAVNPVVDKELIRFNVAGFQFLSVMHFIFRGQTTPSFINTSTTFTYDDLFYKSKTIQNSFFILDYYDSTIKTNQKKLFTSFYKTRINSSNLTDVNSQPYLVIRDPAMNLYIPSRYITSPDTIIYLKIRFFNAKTGFIHEFKFNNSTPSESDQYFTIVATQSNLSYFYFQDPNQSMFEYTVAPQQITNNEANNQPSYKYNDNSSKGDFIKPDGTYGF